MNYAPRSLRELSSLKDILYGGEDKSASPTSSSGPSAFDVTTTRKDNLTDKLMEKLFAAALPSVDSTNGVPSQEVQERLQEQKNKPPFSVPVMARNFSRLNARIGVVFRLQYKILRVMTWKNPNHTFSALAIYSFLCLYPSLFAVSPIVILIFGVMVPAYVKRHPPPPSPLPSYPVPSDGPPLADAPEIKPVPELSRDFLMNMRDIQNSMDDFTQTYDKIARMLSEPTSFKNEEYSSAVYIFLLFLGGILVFLTSYIKWRYIFFILGWFVVLSGHPSARKFIKASSDIYMAPQEQKFSLLFQKFVTSDIIIDDVPEQRHVEIFELQRQGNDVNEWDDWVFSTSPYEKLSQARLAHDRPNGVRFMDEILPPIGWRFSPNSAWKLDLYPHIWTQNRSIVGIDIDSDSKWVYDTVDNGTRGEWRRRRWIRVCERQSNRENQA
ncbi:integral peroxisomal membrane peroxin-domain-containing protein [Dipodascopsis uninucleata]